MPLDPQLSSETLHQLAVRAEEEGCSVDDLLQRLLNKSAIDENPKITHFYGQVLKVVEQAVIATDLDGIINYWNPHAEILYGWHRDEVLGRNILEVAASNLTEQQADAILERISRGELFSGEYQLIHKSGEQFSGHIVSYPINNEAGIPMGGVSISVDITEKKRDEEVLLINQERLQRALDTANTGLWDWDIPNKKIHVSPQYYSILGYELGEFEQTLENWETMVHPEDLRNISYANDQQQSHEIGNNREYRIQHKNGNYIWIQDRSWIVERDEKANPARIIGTITDITAQKRAEADLQQTEMWYRTLFDGSLNPIVVYDVEARIVTLNEVAAHNLQTTTEDAIGTSIKVYLPDRYDILLDRIQNVLKTQEILYVEDYIELPNGNKRWFWSILQPLSMPEAHSDYVQVIYYDITKQKQLDEARQLSDERYRAIMESSLDLVFILECIRDETNNIIDFKFIEFNDRALESTGFSRKELIGKSVFELFPMTREQRFFDRYKHVIKTGESFEQEFETPATPTTSNWYQQQVVKMGDGIAVIIRNITDKKRSEKLLLNHERMKALFSKEREHNALVQQIISALSHDLRTPLTVIASSRELLSKYYDRLSEDKRLRKLEMIDHQIQYALNLLDDTVMMARGHEGQFNPLMVNLATLCQVSVDELSSTLKSNHSLIFINSGLVENVIVDETLVNRILLNLMSNAIKYSPDGSQIRLELDKRSKWVILRVIDRGIGIREEDVVNIFDPFFRTREAQSIHGTGLGLSIVKDCVERHHGYVYVKSKMGQGSTFTVELPTHIDE